ncbi:hypothetical protein VTN77DRAFT_3755 [Rasamsonia byssochlamydoides]|uniref:uncharacterized protein n=1 Tax=Rasamsonia byssochlamydoides TaxID=89139 RepID=UPI00374243AA
MARLSFLLVSCLALLVGIVNAGSAVVDLIPSNFDKVVLKSGKPTLVEFFAPWCGHCKNLAPVYEELAQAFSFASDKLTIAKLDADEHRSIGKKYGVQGFPTIKFFDGKSDQPVEYSGARDLESLSAFITEKTGIRPRGVKKEPSNVVILNDSSFPKEVGGDKHVFVAFTAPWCGHCKRLAPTWEDLANDFARDADVVIAKVDAEAENSKALAKEQGITSYPTIKFFPKGSKEPVPYEGGRTEKEFVEFLNSKTGTHRVVGGGLDDKAGTIPTLDSIVAKYVPSKSFSKLSDEIKKAAKNLQDQYTQYYVKVTEKLNDNAEYVEKEFARLKKILAKGGLAPEKADDLVSRSNILRQFLDEEKTEEKTEEAEAEAEAETKAETEGKKDEL